METTKPLFPDIQTVTAKRPTELTADQKSAFYAEKAAEIIQNKWSDDDPESIAKDLKEMLYPFNDNGYELAKTLEGYRAEASYEIDPDFCEWLDCLWSDYNQLVERNVKAWVATHSIGPVFEKREVLEAFENVSPSFKKGSVVHIVGDYPDIAKYVLATSANDSGGILLPYELVEKTCKKCEANQESGNGD